MIEFRVWCALASIACKFCYYFAFFRGDAHKLQLKCQFHFICFPFFPFPFLCFSWLSSKEVSKMDGWMCVSVRTNANKSVNDFSLSLWSNLICELTGKETDRQTSCRSICTAISNEPELPCGISTPIPPSPHLMRSTEVAPKIKIQIPRLKAAGNTWLAFSWKALQAVWSELRDFSAKAQGLPATQKQQQQQQQKRQQQQQDGTSETSTGSWQNVLQKTLRLLSCCGALISPQITSKATTATIITTMRELRNVVSSCLQFLARIVAREEEGGRGEKKS